jgi:hypothetical protein
MSLKSLVIAIILISSQSFAADKYPTCKEVGEKIYPVAAFLNGDQVYYSDSVTPLSFKRSVQSFKNDTADDGTCAPGATDWGLSLCNYIYLNLDKFSIDSEVRNSFLVALNDFANLFPTPAEVEPHAKACDLKGDARIKLKQEF